MIESRQQAYLDAMEIPVWSLRKAAATEAVPVETCLTLKLGPGSGGILLVCEADTDSASKLANDISRALGKVPVWSWPAEGEGAVEAAVAVDDNLFTTVAIFGDELAAQLFGSELPVNLNSASLVLLPSMHELETRPDARRSLWMDLCRSGMVSAN